MINPIKIIRSHLVVEAFKEDADIMQFANSLSLVSGQSSEKCIRIARWLYPDIREEFVDMIISGQTLDYAVKIYNDTLFQAGWIIRSRFYNIWRLIWGAPTVEYTEFYSLKK